MIMCKIVNLNLMSREAMENVLEGPEVVVVILENFLFEAIRWNVEGLKVGVVTKSC